MADQERSRRQFLATGGLGVALGMAGCLTLTETQDASGGGPSDTGTTTQTDAASDSGKVSPTTTEASEPPTSVTGEWPTVYGSLANANSVDVEHSPTEIAGLWRAEPDASFKWRSLVQADGSVFVSADERPTLYKIDAKTGSFEAFDVNEKAYSPAIGDGQVFVGGGSVRALEVSSGRLQWTASQDTWFGVLGVRDGIVYTYADTGGTNSQLLLALDEASGDEVWRHEPPDVITRPAVADGLVCYHRYGSRRAYARRAASGGLAWESDPLPADPRGPVTVGGQVALFPTQEPGVHALSLSDGTHKWQLSTDGTVSGIAVVGGTAYVGDVGGTIRAVNVESGSVQWKQDAQLNGPPTATPTRVFAPTSTGISVLDAASGETLATQEMIRAPTSGVVATEQLLFVSDGAGVQSYVVD